MTDEILEGVLSEFEKLAEIPRPSKHEEKVSAYLYQHLITCGFEVTQDKFKNIIVEVPASEGKEDAPLTILQAHMDMVCVAEEGYDFDPLTSPIKLLRDEKFLTAEGTSLGADDGIGIAEIIYIAKNFSKGKFENIPHGPLRLIFTVDEEQGMSGVKNIHNEHIDDAQFMINCDSEIFGEIVVGSAGNMYVNFSRQIDFVDVADLNLDDLDDELKAAVEHDIGKFFDDENFNLDASKLSTAIKIQVSGLRGGHSGIDIDDARANAIKILAKVLSELNLNGDIHLASINGGKAYNVIPNFAEAVIATSLNLDDVKNFVEEICAQVKKIFVDEENLTIDVEEVELPEKVFGAEDFEDLIDLLTMIHSGIYLTSSKDLKSVQASTNLSMIRTTDKVEVKLMPRFNTEEIEKEFETLNKTLARLTNFDVEFGGLSPAWNFKPDGKLAKMAAEIFERQNKIPAQIKIIHAGLECSHFIVKNPELDIISIGTTNEFIHSTKEKLHLDTVTPHVNFIVETLKEISELE